MEQGRACSPSNPRRGSPLGLVSTLARDMAHSLVGYLFYIKRSGVFTEVHDEILPRCTTCIYIERYGMGLDT